MSGSDYNNKRYEKNILIKELGPEAQKKMFSSSVFVLGAGGLGSAVIYYLAAAGAGEIIIADSDRPETTNLNRQILHTPDDVNKFKAESAAEKIKKFNPAVRVRALNKRIAEKEMGEAAGEADFIIDASDNFISKFMINDYCVKNKKAFSHAGALALGGQIMTYTPGTPCLRCFSKDVPENAPNSNDEGILGAVAGTLGTLQAAEAVKYLCGAGDLLAGRMLFYDALRMKFREVAVKKRQDCLCDNAEKE